MDTNQLQLENEKLNARLEKAKEVFKQQAADIKAKDEAFIKLRDEYNEHQVELNNTKKDLHIANEKLSEFESKCARYDEVIKSLNEKNDELDTLATSRLADIKKREEDIVNLNKNIEEITGAYNQLNDEVNNLQDNIVSKDIDYKELQDTYNNSVTEQLRYTGELNSKIEKLEGELSEKTEALDKALNEIQSLTTRLNSESGKIEEVKSKTEVAVTSIKKKLQALNDGLGEEFNIFG